MDARSIAKVARFAERAAKIAGKLVAQAEALGLITTAKRRKRRGKAETPKPTKVTSIKRGKRVAGPTAAAEEE